MRKGSQGVTLHRTSLNWTGIKFCFHWRRLLGLGVQPVRVTPGQGPLLLQSRPPRLVCEICAEHPAHFVNPCEVGTSDDMKPLPYRSLPW